MLYFDSLRIFYGLCVIDKLFIIHEEYIKTIFYFVNLLQNKRFVFIYSLGIYDICGLNFSYIFISITLDYFIIAATVFNRKKNERSSSSLENTTIQYTFFHKKTIFCLRCHSCLLPSSNNQNLTPYPERLEIRLFIMRHESFFERKYTTGKTGLSIVDSREQRGSTETLFFELLYLIVLYVLEIALS